MNAYALHIAGQETAPATGRSYETLNPFTGEPCGAMTAPERAGVMRAVADILEQEADRLARLEITDNGKLLRETAGQMAAIPSWFRYFAGVAETARGETIPTAKADFLAYTVHEPVGVVGADRAMELAAPAARLEAGAGPGGRLHTGGQAL